MLLDSNIIIYANSDRADVVLDFIAQHRVCTSAVCVIEVLGYHELDAEDERKLRAFLEGMPSLPVDDDVIREAVALRQLRRMSLGDSIIAATAIVHNQPLATSNTQDFEWIDRLNVIDPTQSPNQN